MHTVRSLVLSVFLAALLLAPAGGEEAILRDGRRLPGQLGLAENRLQFMPSGKQVALLLDQLHQVRFAELPAPACLIGTVFHVVLADGQRLTGELHALDGEKLQIRAPWERLLSIPRQAVRALTQPTGYLSLVADDFESGLDAWQVTGAAALDGRQHVSGRHSLLLNVNGQAELAVALPLASGRVGVNFFDAGNTRGAHWLVELVFQRGKQARPLRIGGGDTSYGVEPPGMPGELGRQARSSGWHRLVVEFGPESMRAYVDDVVLWSGRLEPGAFLSKVRLECVARPDKGTAEGAIWFDDFTLARAVEVLRHDDADARQDEVWLASGDQLLGRVVRADRHAMELDARFGKRTLSWGDVRGLYLCQGKNAEAAVKTGQTRVWLRAASGGELDQLVGQVRGLSASRLTLRHALLGDLEIERPWLRRLASAE